MIKEFQIKDILAAVNTISKMEKKKDKTQEVKNDFIHKKDDILTLNNQVKSDKSEILVLDNMID